MNTGTMRTVLLLLALCAQPLWADEKADAEDEAIERRLDEARQQLEEASREVAELSAELGRNAIEFVREFDVDGRRAMLGINLGGPGAGDEDGVRVEGVTPGGPADAAGLRSGDLLLSLNGNPLRTDGKAPPQRELLRLMREVEPGEQVSVEYLRDGRKETATITTKELETHGFPFVLGHGMPGMGELHMLHEFNSRWGDMELVALTSGLGEYFGTDAGILVVRAPDDPEIDLEDGDVILRIDGRTPTSPNHALRILRSYQGGERLSIDIMRKQRPMTVEIRLSKREGDVEESDFEFNITAPGPEIET